MKEQLGVTVSTAILFLIAGLSAAYYQVEPWPTFSGALNNLEAFIEGGDVESDASVMGKMEHDQGGFPHRKIISNVKPYPVEETAEPFTIDVNKNILLKGYKDNPPPGYILLSGYFHIKKGVNSAFILVRTDGTYVRKWHHAHHMVTNIDVERGILFSDNKARSWCAQSNAPEAVAFDRVDHTIEPAPDGTYWTGTNSEALLQYRFGKNKSKKGAGIQSIFYDDIAKKNADMGILFSRVDVEKFSRYYYRGHKGRGIKLQPKKLMGLDPYHQNDVEPFVDARFKTASGYALLVSMRNQNLIFVLDPDTKKILWYAQGVSQWQHDVDYHEGKIYVYDNGPMRGYSRIISFSMDLDKNPAQDYQVVLDGKSFGWQQRMVGNHDVVTLNGMRYHLISHQGNGSALLFDENQKPVFIIQNFVPDEKTQLLGKNISQDIQPGLQITHAEFIKDEEFEHLNSLCDKK